MSVTTLDQRAALVVVDLQQGVLAAETVPHRASQVLERSVRLADAFRQAGHLVVLVRVSFAADGSDAPPGRTGGPAGGARPEGWDRLAEELSGRPEDVVVTKRNWGAFHGTELDTLLRRRGITQVFLPGIATSIGVDSTARQAHEHGYHVVLVTDAMADRDDASHTHTVERIGPRLGETGTADEVLALLSAPGGRG